MSAGAGRVDAGVEARARSHFVLRFAVGVTAAFLLCEGFGWAPTFMAPVLAAVLMASLPTCPPLKTGVVLVLVMTLAAAAAFVLSALLRGIPFVLFGMIGVVMLLCFHGMLVGKPKLPAMLLLICLATIPVLMLVSPAIAGAMPMILVRGMALAVVIIWIVSLPWPLTAPPAAAAEMAPNPNLASPLAVALLSTAVVLPLMLVYLLFGIADALPVLVATVMLVVNFDVRRSGMHALAMILGNFAGGLLALLLHSLLLTTPTLPFLGLLLFLVLLGFGQRIAAGGPMAAVALIACNAMLIVLSSAIASEPGSLAIWLTRLLQFTLAGAFAMAMMSLVWHRAARPPVGRPGPGASSPGGRAGEPSYPSVPG